MDRYPDYAGRVRPGARIAVWGALLALELSFAAPAAAGPHDATIPGIVSEFQQICTELDQARGALRSGALSDGDFADRILELFVRADSLENLVPRAGWVRRAAGNGDGTFALSKALRYLIESLRENYVGIAARNGNDFVEADRAYQAAVAWRPELEAAAATAAR